MQPPYIAQQVLIVANVKFLIRFMIEPVLLGPRHATPHPGRASLLTELETPTPTTKEKNNKLKLVRDVRKECGSCNPLKECYFSLSLFLGSYSIQVTGRRKKNPRRSKNLPRVGSNHQPLDYPCVTVELFQVRM